jgi:hypothetical protein
MIFLPSHILRKMCLYPMSEIMYFNSTKEKTKGYKKPNYIKNLSNYLIVQMRICKVLCFTQITKIQTKNRTWSDWLHLKISQGSLGEQRAQGDLCRRSLVPGAQRLVARVNVPHWGILHSATPAWSASDQRWPEATRGNQGLPEAASFHRLQSP